MWVMGGGWMDVWMRVAGRYRNGLVLMHMWRVWCAYWMNIRMGDTGANDSQMVCLGFNVIEMGEGGWTHWWWVWLKLVCD